MSPESRERAEGVSYAQTEQMVLQARRRHALHPEAGLESVFERTMEAYMARPGPEGRGDNR